MNNKLMKTVALALLVTMLPTLSVVAADFTPTPTTTPSETVTPAPGDNVTDEVTPEDNIPDDTVQQVNTPEDYRDRILGFYAENSVLTTWWDVVALYGAGADLSQYTLPQWTSESLGENAAATDYAGIIFGLIASDGNPHDFFGRDIADELAKMQDSQTGLFGSYPNQQIYAILALDAAKEPYNRIAAVNALISTFRTADGAFGYLPFDPSFGTEITADVDITAQTLLILDSEENSDIISSAVEYLASQQLENGGYASWGTENSNTLEAVISTLSTLTLLEDQRFIKNERSLSDVLGDYILENGMLTWEAGSTDENLLATQQGLIAFGDIIAGKSVFLRLASEQVCSTLNANVRIEGSAANVLNVPISVKGYNLNILDAIKAALDANNIPYEIEGSEYGSYIKSVNFESEGKFGGWDGWLVAVNGSPLASSADATLLNEGDEILLYYGMFEPNTLIPQYQLSTDTFLQNTPFNVTVTATYFDYTDSQNKTVPITGATVEIGENKFTTNATGVASVAASVSGRNTVKIYKETAGSYPAIVRIQPFTIDVIPKAAPRPAGGGSISVSTGKNEQPYKQDEDKKTHEDSKPDENNKADEDTKVEEPKAEQPKELTFADKNKISDWAAEGITKAVHAGLFKGDHAGNINPQKSLTRAELATLLLRLTNTPENKSDCKFMDINADDWFFGAVCTAFDSGFMNGVGEDSFAPLASVTREQAAVVFARVLQLSAKEKAQYKDSDEISDWATDAISAVTAAGIMEGSDGNFSPKQVLTREMCAVIMARALEFAAKE